jgi:hypothetical protein
MAPRNFTGEAANNRRSRRAPLLPRRRPCELTPRKPPRMPGASAGAIQDIQRAGPTDRLRDKRDARLC